MARELELKLCLTPEGVERLSEFKHHVIGHIHHVADAANAHLFQEAPQPVRAGTDFYALNHPGGVARAKLSVFEAHGNQIVDFDR